jgi:hypothetical protein
MNTCAAEIVSTVARELLSNHSQNTLECMSVTEIAHENEQIVV